MRSRRLEGFHEDKFWGICGMEREIETRCLHLEEEEGRSDNYGAISYPIYQTATYAHPGVGQSTGYDYSGCKIRPRSLWKRRWRLWRME